MDKLTKKGLDGTQLKTIALVLMVLDHIHYFFEFTGCIPTVFSMLGRLSAPLFLFCTVEGFAHTHDRKRYFVRIWAIGAAMAALEFFMIYAKAFRRGDGFYPLNAIFQDLALLCIVWQGIDWLREKKLAKGIGAIAAVLCWPFVVIVFLLLFPGVQEMPIASSVVAFVITSPLPMWTAITDGGWSFLLGGVLLYALRGHRRVQLTAWAVLIFLCDFALTFGMACPPSCSIRNSPQVCMTSSKASLKVISYFPLLMSVRMEWEIWISSGKMTKRSIGHHHCISSSRNAYQGKMPLEYARMRRSMDRSPPTASNPSGSP